MGDAVGIGVSGTTPGNVVTISQADAPAFGVGDFSFSFWVKRLDTAADTNGVDGIFDALRDTTQGFQALFVADKFRLRLDEPGPDFILADSGAAIPTDGSW
ncbi:MAG: hypothetical protein GWO24_02215, partial [Akkermansiaceae bacterium]|nr:hypothetical protein [Akkermansiaceae bacterium]